VEVTTRQGLEGRRGRLGDRLTYTTSLSIEEAIEAIRRVCERESERHRRPYHVQTRRNQVLVGYLASPRTAVGRSRPGLLAGHWLVALRFARDDQAPGVTGREQPIEIRLTNWVIDSDGRRDRSDRYAGLVDAILEAMGARRIR
jgi:hypothetical protein